MRTSLNEVKALEELLLDEGNPAERLVTQAKVLTNHDLQEQAGWQLRTYELVREYGRQKLRREIQSVEKQLFTSSRYRSFQDRIRSIFKR